MISLFKTANKESQLNLWLLLLRLAVAGFMLSHGEPKLEKFFGADPITFSDPLGIGVSASLGLAVFAEFFCSMLIAFGLLTRFATLALIINMSVAAFVAHAGAPFAKRELALVYLLFYITLFVLGAGKYSLDNYLTGRRRKGAAELKTSDKDRLFAKS